jgi:hypothetical protein
MSSDAGSAIAIYTYAGFIVFLYFIILLLTPVGMLFYGRRVSKKTKKNSAIKRGFIFSTTICLISMAVFILLQTLILISLWPLNTILRMYAFTWIIGTVVLWSIANIASWIGVASVSHTKNN